MATEGGTPVPISEKEQNETGDLGCAQVLNPPEYTNKLPEDLKEHSYELEIDGSKTDSVASQSSEMIGQYTTYKPVTATNECSISSETVKDQSLHSVTAATADTSEGEVFVEAPSRDQIQLEDICNRFNAGLDGENPINEGKDKPDSGNPKNLSSEANFTDTSLYTASATHVPLEVDDHPVKNSSSMSDEHIFETLGANQSTERAAAWSEEKISTEIPENSVANQYQHLENLGDEVDDKQLEVSIDVMHGTKYSEPIKDRERSETQESTENLSVNPERLSAPEDLGETGLKNDDEENDSVNKSSGHPSEEQSLKDDGRVHMEKYHEEEEITGVVSSNETTQRQDITSVEGKEEKLEESSYLASEEKILKTIDATKKESEIKDVKTSADASVKESSYVQLSSEKSVQEDEMLSDKVGNVSSKEPEKIQETSVTIMETETWKEKDMEMDPHTGTLQMEKEPEESKCIEDSKADKDVEYINLVATEKSPETKYASKDTENEELDVKKQKEDGQKDVSISTKMEFPSIQNDQVNNMIHKETYNLLHEENSLQANNAIDAEDTLGGENLNGQAKAKPEQEKFEEVCRIVEALDARETVAIAISMDDPHVGPATETSVEETIQDKETAHSRNEKENEVQEEEETNYGNLDTSASSQLTDETGSLNEVKETQKLAEISEVMQSNDHCHEKVLNQNESDDLITKYGTTGVSKSHNEEGIQEHEDKDGKGNDKIERPLEDKHVEAIAEMKQSKWIKSSEKEHEQEAVSVNNNEHVDETINKETLGPAQIKDETDSVNLENRFIMVSKEVEVTEGIGKSEKENIASKSLIDMEEITKKDEVMCEETEKAAAELMHEYQVIMTKDLNETGIAIEKNENSGENVDDLHVAHKLIEETIQVCENMGDIKQELEPEKIEKASELASEDKSHMTVEDTETTDLDSSRDNVSMDTTLGALSTTQAFFMGNSQNATDPENAEEKIYETINDNIDHDKHIEGSLEMVAQKDIHKKIEENRSMEDITFGDEQIDEAKAGACPNENQVEGEKLDEREELKHAKGTYEDAVNREICLEVTPNVDTPENVQENDKWENKLENPSAEVLEKIIMAEVGVSNKEDTAEKASPEEKEESPKGEASVTLNRLDTEEPSHKPDGKEEKISNIINQGGDTEPARVMDEAPNNSIDDISDTHELAAQCIDDLVGSKHEEVSNSTCDDQILETADTKDNKEDDDRKEAHQKLEVISESVSEDKSQKTTSETEATKIENLSTDHNHNNMISDMTNKNGDTEIDKPMDEESWENNIKDPPNCHALAAQRIHDAGEKHETETNNVPEKQIHQTHSNKDSTGTDISKERTDSDRSDFISESVPEDQSGESEGPKFDNAADDDNIKDPKIAGIIDDAQNAKMKDNEGIHKNTNDMPDAVIRKNEDATNSSCEKQIHQTTDTEDTITFNNCKEKTDSEKPEIITVSAVKDQYQERIGESEATKSFNLTNDDSLNNIDSEKTHSGKFEIDSVSVVEDQCQETTDISEATKSHILPYDDSLKNTSPDIGDPDDGHETAKMKDESILEDNMDIISGGHASVMEKLPGKVDEKHEATNFTSEEQTCQATDTKENIQVALYYQNIAIKKLEVIAESVPRDENEDTMSSKIEKTFEEDMLDDMVGPMSKSQALVEDYLQKDENPTLYAESTEVHESTDHSISEEDKSSESKTSGSSLHQSSESPTLKEEPNNDAASGSNLKHNVVENACELEYKEEQDEEVPNKKETSDAIFEESPSMMSDTLVRSAEILSGEQTTGENEATEDKACLNTGCDSVEEGLQEGKEETNFVDASPETVYSDKSNETDELNNSIKNGIANKEVETSDFTTAAENFEKIGNGETAKTETPEDDERQKMKVCAYDDQSHDTSSTCKEHTKIKLQNEQNENAEIEDEESTNNRVNDSPVTNALDGEAASGSMHGGQGESITWEEETEKNKSLDQEKYKSVAQEDSEVVNSKDEECISKIDDNLSIMPVPSEEIGQEIEEKNQKNPDCEEQIHRSITTNTNMDHDMLEDDKNIEGIERASVGVSKEQSHEGTVRTGIIENDMVECALSASQNFDEEKTSKIAFSSEGNNDGHEAKQVSKSAIDTLLKEAQATEGAASGTSMQSQGIESDELSQVPTSVPNSKLESLDPEINQEDVLTRERVSDASIGTPSNLVSAEIASADRAENTADLTTEEGKAVKVIDKEVKESVVASHHISQTTTEVKSMEIEPEDNALTAKRASAEENLQEDGRQAGSEVHSYDAIKDSETTEMVALENENEEKKEDKEILQPKKMEYENQEGRKEIQAQLETSEIIYTSECNKESSEQKGTSDKGSEKETLEDVKLEKPLDVFDVMEEGDFTDQVVPENKNKEQPEVERSLQIKEMEDDKQEEGNKTQSVEKVSEAINANKCNKESPEEKEISEKGAEKQKSDDVELEDLLNVASEKVDIAYGTENINSDGEEKVANDILEESMHKKEDNTLENTIAELDPVNHNNEPIHDSDATESIIPKEKILKVVNFGATKEEDQIKMVDDSSMNNDLVEEIKDVEPSGSQPQKESVEPKAFDKTEEKLQSIGLEEEEPERNEKLAVGSQNDTNEVMQFEEPSNMVFDRLPTAGLNEKTEKMITAEKDVQAPDVTHERDGPSHEQIQGDENEANKKKPEIKRELEETDTIVNDIPNDKIKESNFMPSEQDLVKLGWSETETNEMMHLEEPSIMVFDRLTTAELNEKTENMIIAEDVQAPDVAHIRDGPSHELIQGDEDEAKDKKSETKREPEETDTILNEILNDKAKESGFMPSEQDLVKTELSENDTKEVTQLEEPSIMMFDKPPTTGLNEKTKKMITAEEDAQAPDVAHVREEPSHGQIQGEENEAREKKAKIKREPEEIDTILNDKIKKSDFMPSEQDLVKLGLSENKTNEVMHHEEPSTMMSDTLPTAELNEKTEKMNIAEEDVQALDVVCIRDGPSHEQIQEDEDEAKEKKSETKGEPEETDTILNEILNDKVKESGFMPSEQDLAKTGSSENDAKEVMQLEEPSIIMFDRLLTAGLNEKTEKMIAAEESAPTPNVAYVGDGPSHGQIQGDENEAKEKKPEIKKEPEETNIIVNDILNDKIKESDFMPSEQDLVKLELSDTETNEVMHLEEPLVMVFDRLTTTELNEKTKKIIIAKEDVQAPDVAHVRDGPSHELIQGDDDEAKKKKPETKREPEQIDTILNEILNDKAKESGFMPSEEDHVKTELSEDDAKEVTQLEPSIIMFDKLSTAGLNEKTKKMIAAEEDAQAPNVAHARDGPSHEQIQGDEDEAKEKKPEIKRESDETDTIVNDIPNDKIKESDFMPSEEDLVKLGLFENETNEMMHLEESSITVFDKLTTAELNEETENMIIAEDVQAPDVAHVTDGPSHEQIQGDEDEAKEKKPEIKREPDETDTIVNDIPNDKIKESDFMPSEEDLVKLGLFENETNEMMHLEESSIMVFDKLTTAELNEETENMIIAEEDVQAPNVAHVTDGPSYEQIQGDEDEAKEKKPETKREPEKTDTILNEILNDKAKESGFIPSEQDLVKMELSENDTKEVMQLEEPSIMMFDKLPTTGLNEKTKKMITAEEDGQDPDVAHVRDGPSREQIQGDENEAKEKKPEIKREPEETDTEVNEILNDKIKESDFMPSEQDLVKLGLCEKTETKLPVDKESAPKESTQIDTKTKIMGVELADDVMFDAEGQTATKKIEHISTNTVSVDRTFNTNSMAFNANEKDEETIDQEDTEKLEEASNLVSNNKVDEGNDSSTAFTEDKENSQNSPIKKATEVSSPAEEKEIVWQAEGAVHEVIDFDNSENEENQQTDQDELPVSRFLMDRILQEEGDKLAEACDVKHEDKLQENIQDEQNDVNISKQETNSASLSAEQVKDNTSMSEGKVEDLIKTEGSFDLGQEQIHELKKNTEIAILKDDESLESNLHDTSLTLIVGEYVKVEVLQILAKESTHIVSDNSIELALEEGGPESILDVDELKTPDAMISIAAHENMTRSVIQKDDESLKKNIAIVKAFEDDSVKKEGGKESPEVPQDIAGIDKVSYATFQKQTPTISEPVQNADSEIQDKETVLNLQGDQQNGKSSQSSCVEDTTLGEALEIQSGGIKVETGKGNQDGTTEIQMQDAKDNLNEELKVSASHNVQQSELIVVPANETAQAGERFLAERSPTVSVDEKQTKETADAMEKERNDEEKDEKEQEDEHKTEEPGHDGAVVVEANEADTISADEKQTKETADAMEKERNDEEKDEKEQEDKHKTEESGHDAVAVEAKEADIISADEKQTKETADATEKEKNDEEKDEKDQEDKHKTEAKADTVSADEKQTKEIADTMEKERNDEEKDEKEEEDEHKTEESGHDVAVAVEAKEADTVIVDEKQAKEITDAMEKERNDEEKDEKEEEDEDKTEESGHDVAVAVEAQEGDTVIVDEKQAKEIADAMEKERNDKEKDEKEQEDEHKTEESGHDVAVAVEAKEAALKPAHKKSHNILSGVGSKVKHSIAKVKKVITGKSSHSKTVSPR